MSFAPMAANLSGVSQLQVGVLHALMQRCEFHLQFIDERMQ